MGKEGKSRKRWECGKGERGKGEKGEESLGKEQDSTFLYKLLQVKL